MRSYQVRQVPEPLDHVDILDIIEHEANTNTQAVHWIACVLDEFIDPYEAVLH